MKKVIKILTLMVFVSVLIACLVTAQTTNPWSASSIGGEKNAFTSLDKIYVKSDVICEPSPSTANLYIVENTDQWNDGIELEDARGDFQEISLKDSKIPLAKIWDTPKAGEYDIVIDCNTDGKWSRGEPIDNFYRNGFVVTAIAGRGKAEVGAKDAGNRTWRYDPESVDLVNEILQLKLTAEGENIELKNITIRAIGDGNDAEIDLLEVYVDENSNGVVDEGEVMAGDSQPAYPANDAVVTLSFEAVLDTDAPENILIVYTMKQTISKGDFALVVDSISGIGEDSKKVIAFSGLPITSGKTSVLPEKTCLGELALEFDPNQVQVSKQVIATLSGLSGCYNKTAILRMNPCESSLQDKVGECVLANNSCNISFNSLATLTYYACIDKNENGNLSDFGESAFAKLEVSAPALEEINQTEENVTEEEITEENVTEENVPGEAAPITGGAVGVWGKLSAAGETGSFFVLLEVTLLLILFVLVIIMFRLKGGRKKEE